MKEYLRVILGKGSVYAKDCVAGGFIGTDYGIKQDLTNRLSEDWREFKKEFVPLFLANNPGKSKKRQVWLAV